MPAIINTQKSGLFVRAYRGDAITLPAMNMAQAEIVQQPNNIQNNLQPLK